jgi:hypothetical protein
MVSFLPSGFPFIYRNPGVGAPHGKGSKDGMDKVGVSFNGNNDDIAARLSKIGFGKRNVRRVVKRKDSNSFRFIHAFLVFLILVSLFQGVYGMHNIDWNKELCKEIKRQLPDADTVLVSNLRSEFSTNLPSGSPLEDKVKDFLLHYEGDYSKNPIVQDIKKRLKLIKNMRDQNFNKLRDQNFSGIANFPVIGSKLVEELLFKDGELCNGTLSYDSPLVLCKPFHGHVHGDFTNGIPEKGCLWEKYSNGNLIAAGTVDYDGKFIFKKDARNQIFIKMKNKNFTGITDVPVGFEVKPFEELLFKDGELCNGTLSYDSPLVLCKPFHGHVHGDFTNGIPEKGCLWEKYSNGNLIADDY